MTSVRDVCPVNKLGHLCGKRSPVTMTVRSSLGSGVRGNTVLKMSGTNGSHTYFSGSSAPHLLI